MFSKPGWACIILSVYLSVCLSVSLQLRNVWCFIHFHWTSESSGDDDSVSCVCVCHIKNNNVHIYESIYNLLTYLLIKKYYMMSPFAIILTRFTDKCVGWRQYLSSFRRTPSPPLYRNFCHELLIFDEFCVNYSMHVDIISSAQTVTVHNCVFLFKHQRKRPTIFFYSLQNLRGRYEVIRW